MLHSAAHKEHWWHVFWRGRHGAGHGGAGIATWQSLYHWIRLSQASNTHETLESTCRSSNIPLHVRKALDVKFTCWITLRNQCKSNYLTSDSSRKSRLKETFIYRAVQGVLARMDFLGRNHECLVRTDIWHPP